MSQVAKYEKPRVIQGTMLKSVDGRWRDRDGLEPPSELLVVGTTRAHQCWGRDRDLLDTILEQPGEPLPDVDALNAQIPREEWGVGLDGQPRPPWQLNYVVYLIDPVSAGVFTFINSTVGARIAWEKLTDAIKWKRMLHGANVAPIVKLDSRPMRTKMGTKQRPEFTVVEWRELNGKGPTQIGSPSAPQLEYRPEPPPATQHPAGPDVIKRIESADEAAPPAKAKQKSASKIGKPVKPTTISEEIDDGLPGDLAPPTSNPLAAG
jgi:hypothetical protein